MTAASATNGFVLRDAPAYREALPQNIMLNEYVCLLITPLRPTWALPMARPKAALGAVFDVTPPNIEVKSDEDCTYQSALIEGLFRILPEGSALQAIMSMYPTSRMTNTCTGSGKHSHWVCRISRRGCWQDDCGRCKPR
jgi:hypothetical protein